MAHYIDADRLRAEIEKRLQENADKALLFGAAFAGRTAEDNEIVNLLDSLQQEQPEMDGLEEEARKYLTKNFTPPGEEPFKIEDAAYALWFDDVCHIARHFAEWGAEHLRDSTKMIPEGLDEAADAYVGNHPEIDEGVYTYAKRLAFKAGAEWQKEQMMREAVECDVIVPIYEGNNVWSAEIKIPGRYEPGNKVKVIVIKEDEL